MSGMKRKCKVVVQVGDEPGAYKVGVEVSVDAPSAALAAIIALREAVPLTASACNISQQELLDLLAKDIDGVVRSMRAVLQKPGEK